MSEIILDTIQLDKFTTDVLNLVKEEPKLAKSFMQKVGNKARSEVRKGYKHSTRKRSGKLLKGIARGRVYRWKGDEWHVRVYSKQGKGKANYANVVEYGRSSEAKHGKQDGVFVMKKERESFDNVFAKATEKFVDELLKKGFL